MISITSSKQLSLLLLVALSSLNLIRGASIRGAGLVNDLDQYGNDAVLDEELPIVDEELEEFSFLQDVDEEGEEEDDEIEDYDMIKDTHSIIKMALRNIM